MGAGGAEAGGPLDFLQHNPQFMVLRRAVQGNPNILVPMLQVRTSQWHQSQRSMIIPLATFRPFTPLHVIRTILPANLHPFGIILWQSCTSAPT